MTKKDLIKDKIRFMLEFNDIAYDNDLVNYVMANLPKMLSGVILQNLKEKYILEKEGK